MTDTQTPEVTARVEENWAALEVDGETETIHADTEEEVRHEVLRRTMRIAADSNTDVTLTATDRDGVWRLIVTPQGDISETATPINPHGAHQGADDESTLTPETTDAAASGPTEVDPPVLIEPGTGEDVPRWNDDDSADERRPDLGGTSEPAADGVLDDTIVEETTIRTTRSVPDLDERTAPTNPTVISDPPPFAMQPNTATGPDKVTEPATATQPNTPSTEIDGEVSIWDTVKRVNPPAVETPATTATSEAPIPPVPNGPPGSAQPTAPDESPAPAPDESRRSELPPFAEPSTGAGGSVTAADLGDPPASVDVPAASDDSNQSPADTPTPAPAALPTLADFQATQPPPVAGPATQGWRGAIRRGTGGLISPAPSPSEQRHREAVASVTRSLSGPRTICVINPKGGAHKTTASMLIAATFGLYRGGYTLAWDNNETRGTLGWRAHRTGHSNTAVDLLTDIDKFADLRSARVGDLDNYVRSQAEAQFDVLASDEDAAASSMIDDEAFRRLHETLQRFYRIIVVDTGNNMRASNWEAAIAAADQLVIVSAIREDTAGGAAWMVEGLAKKGQDAKLRDAVTILSAPDKNVDAQLRTRLTEHFGSLTRDVVEVPYDPALVSGAGISMGALAPTTREAWLMATATIANGL